MHIFRPRPRNDLVRKVTCQEVSFILSLEKKMVWRSLSDGENLFIIKNNRNGAACVVPKTHIFHRLNTFTLDLDDATVLGLVILLTASFLVFSFISSYSEGHTNNSFARNRAYNQQMFGLRHESGDHARTGIVVDTTLRTADHMSRALLISG